MTLSYATLAILIRTCILLGIGVPAVIVVRNKLIELLNKRFTRHISTLIGSVFFYSVIMLIAVSILHDFGFHLSGFLGAAGIIGLAVGFAAQTSISNVISGLFLVLDDTCKIGDSITITGYTGIVESISFFSIQLRTSDNKLIRLSNEFLLKNAVINNNYYDKVRLDIEIIVSAETSLTSTEAIIVGALQQTALLTQPTPSFALSMIEQGSRRMVIKAWAPSSSARDVSASLIANLYHHANQHKIIIAASRIN